MFLIPHHTSKIGWILAGRNGLNWTSLEEGRKEMNRLASFILFFFEPYSLRISIISQDL